MSLLEQVEPGVLECPLRGLEYLPLDVIDRTITTETVRNSLSRRSRIFQNSLPGRIVQQAKKIFAILVLIDESYAIKELFQEGLKDEHLPLEKRSRGDKFLVSNTGGKFHSFRHWDYFKVKCFLEKQWVVQAPVFNTMGEYISLNPRCALPLLEKVDKVGGAHNSTVHKAELHSYHQNFTARRTEVEVAVKELYCKDKNIAELFNHEKDNLEKVQQLQHEHIIKHIAICLDGTLGYVLFPWAQGGSLSDFWKSQDSKKGNAKFFLWCFRQMLGLANALQALHELNCRHGDLKPDNILDFVDGNGKNVLVIADLGVSRVHTLSTDLRRDPTSTKATTPSYEGPEVFEYERQKRPRARTYDIWSIGCIFLEFAIWLLHDREAIQAFRLAREAPDYCFYKSTGGGRAMVHSKVSEAMDALREDPRCNNKSALRDLVDLIDKHLLQIKVESRYSAKQLHDNLQVIVQQAEKDRPYLFSTVHHNLTRPTVFQRPESFLGQGTRILADTGTT